MPEREIVITDSSGSKITITRFDDWMLQFAFSGYLRTGEPRRANIKRFIWVDEIIGLRRQISNTLDSQEFEWCVEQEGRIPEEPQEFSKSFRLGVFRVGFRKPILL